MDKLSKRWSNRANKYGLYSKDRGLALLCLDALHDIAQLEGDIQGLKELCWTAAGFIEEYAPKGAHQQVINELRLTCRDMGLSVASTKSDN